MLRLDHRSVADDIRLRREHVKRLPAREHPRDLIEREQSGALLLELAQQGLILLRVDERDERPALQLCRLGELRRSDLGHDVCLPCLIARPNLGARCDIIGVGELRRGACSRLHDDVHSSLGEQANRGWRLHHSLLIGYLHLFEHADRQLRVGNPGLRRSRRFDGRGKPHTLASGCCTQYGRRMRPEAEASGHGERRHQEDEAPKVHLDGLRGEDPVSFVLLLATQNEN